MRSRDPRAVRSFGVTPSPAALSCRTRSVCARTTSRRPPACSAPQDTVHSPLSPGFSVPGVRGRQGGRSPASGAASRAAWARTHGPFLSRPAPAAGRRHVPAPARHPCSERHLRLRGPSGARPAAASHCAAVWGDALSLLGPPGPSPSLQPGFFFLFVLFFCIKWFCWEGARVIPDLLLDPDSRVDCVFSPPPRWHRQAGGDGAGADTSGGPRSSAREPCRAPSLSVLSFSVFWTLWHLRRERSCQD